MARAGLLGAFASWLCALLVCAAGLALAAPVSLSARGSRRRDARAPDIHVVALRRCRLLPTQHVVRSRDSGRCGRPGGDGSISRPVSPQRKANLSASLNEYLRFGLEAGIFFAS